MTGDDDGLLAEMIDTTMFAIRDGFEALWARPNAAPILEDFLARKIVFAVTRDGIDVLVKPDDEP